VSTDWAARVRGSTSATGLAAAALAQRVLATYLAAVPAPPAEVGARLERFADALWNRASAGPVQLRETDIDSLMVDEDEEWSLEVGLRNDAVLALLAAADELGVPRSGGLERAIQSSDEVVELLADVPAVGSAFGPDHTRRLGATAVYRCEHEWRESLAEALEQIDERDVARAVPRIRSLAAVGLGVQADGETG
jgi:hypothetical protein